MAQLIKFVCVGNDGVGKTSLLFAIAGIRLPTTLAVPTLYEYQHQQPPSITVDERAYRLCLWDSFGGEDYDRVRPLAYPQTDLFLVLFSLSNRHSFEAVERHWVPEITHHCPDVPWVLVGTHSDVFDEPLYELQEEKGLDVVTIEEAGALAQRLGAAGYRECSAATFQGVEQLVSDSIRIFAQWDLMRRPGPFTSRINRLLGRPYN